MEKKYLSLLHTWLTDPGSFFTMFFERAAALPKRKQRIVAGLTFLVPFATSACMAWFLLKNAIVIILHRFVPASWAPVAYLGVSFLVILAIRGFHHLLLAARMDRLGNGRLTRHLRVMPVLDHARNNLCMLPALVVTACMPLTYTGFTWNVYHYGSYLTFMFWFGLLWSGWMIGHSSAALPAIEGPTKRVGTTTPEQHAVRRVIIVSAISFLLFSLVLDATLPFLVGAGRMPLFFKLAYLLMHGN